MSDMEFGFGFGFEGRECAPPHAKQLKAANKAWLRAKRARDGLATTATAQTPCDGELQPTTFW